MPRRYSPKLKFQVVLELLKGDKTSNQVARAHGVHPNSAGLWKRTFLEKEPEIFAKDGVVGGYERRIAELEQLLGRKDDLIDLIHRKRLQIEEASRDMKFLFGFKRSVLKKSTQERVETMFFVVIIAMGLLFEKSGYRWAKYYNTASRKEFSLIHVTKDRITDSWTGLRVNPFFPLRGHVFYRL